MVKRILVSSSAAAVLALSVTAAAQTSTNTSQQSGTVTVTGCLVRQTGLGAAYTPAVGANQNGELVLTKAAMNGEQRRPASPDSRTAVPGSSPSGSGTGTINNTAGAGQAPVDATERSFVVAGGRGADLNKLVGQRVELVGMLEEEVPTGTSGTTARATGSTPATTDRDRQRGSAAPAGPTGSAGPGSRSEGDAAPVAHPSAPLQRLTVSSFRPVGGTCP
jgi:hypothetical protein